jgi:hypothetical protein
MSDPRKREDLRIGARNNEVRRYPNEYTWIRVGSRWISSSFDDGPLEEIKDAMELGRGPGIPEATFWPMMRRN